jgi:hypothetical protein
MDPIYQIDQVARFGFIAKFKPFGTVFSYRMKDRPSVYPADKDRQGVNAGTKRLISLGSRRWTTSK